MAGVYGSSSQPGGLQRSVLLLSLPSPFYQLEDPSLGCYLVRLGPHLNEPTPKARSWAYPVVGYMVTLGPDRVSHTVVDSQRLGL